MALGPEPVLRQGSGGPEVDVGQWQECGACGALAFRRHLARDLHICKECGYQFRMAALDRVEQLLDPGSPVLLRPALPEDDPLAFVDARSYPQRLSEARARTGLDEAVVFARGTIAGLPVMLGCMEFAFLGGSLGMGVGESLVQAARTAGATGVPFVILTASGGARMQEGVLALLEMARTSRAMADLDEAGVLTVTVVTDPTYGGVAASFASLSDIILAEPGARMGFAGPRVIAQTTGGRLPDGFQTAEYLVSCGLLDAVVPRRRLRDVLARLLRVGAGHGAVLPPGPDPILRDATQLPMRDPLDTVRLARHTGRPTTRDHLHAMLDEFEELHGDRMSGDCSAIVGGVGVLRGVPLVVIGHQKGHTTAELVARNFGRATPAGHRKAARLMRLAAKLKLPLVTLVDTQGADPGVEAERAGQAASIASTLALMSGLPVPIVAVITGEGGSGGALSLAVADRVLICANGTLSVISPEGCAAILWRDPAATPAAAAALKLSAGELLRRGVVDGVVPEPPAGAHTDPVRSSELVTDAVCAALRDVMALDPAQLMSQRRGRLDRHLGGRPATT